MPDSVYKLVARLQEKQIFRTVDKRKQMCGTLHLKEQPSVEQKNHLCCKKRAKMCGWSTQDFPFLTNILSLIYSVRIQRANPQFDHARTMMQAWNSPTVEQMTRTSEYK